MKNPFIITSIVFFLFVMLIFFSIFQGPISNDLFNVKGTDPIIYMNRAVSSGDIEKCEGDVSCKNVFVFTQALKSKDPETCNGIDNEESKINCKDNVIFLKATSAVVVNTDYCDQIQDEDIRRLCEVSV